MDSVELLVNFGLTRQEATIYNLLFAEGKLNGYEASKLSGISRSNAYNALASLVEKGACYVIEQNSVCYTPVPVEEFCNNKIRMLNSMKEELKEIVPKPNKKLQGYISITGEKNIYDKITNMLLEVKERVYVALSYEILIKYKDELEDLVKKNIKVVVISDKDCNIDGAIFYVSQINKEHIRIIVDSQYVLTGEITNNYNSTCLYSSNNNLVEVFKEALANKISLIEMNEGEK